MSKKENKSEKGKSPETEKKILDLRISLEEYLKIEELKTILPPGHFLKNVLQAFNIKHKRFAEYIEMSPTNFSAFINGKRKLKPHLALILEAILETDALIWMRVQLKNEIFIYMSKNKGKYDHLKLEDLLNLTD